MKKILLTLAVVTFASNATSAILAPVNPDASPKAKAIYTYLQNLKGQGILSGQESMLWDSTSFDNFTYSASSPYSFRDRYVFRKNGGKYPAIYESDFGDISSSALSDRQRIVDILKARAPKGTIFMLNWHTGNAAAVDGNGYEGSKNLNNAASIIDKMLTPGDAMNTTWLARLDVIAGYLKQLRDSNIVVLWRPFHENNGNFFWWGQQARFKELWQQMYDRFTRYHKLDNLLWVYNANHFQSSGTDANWVRKNYPGDSLVDIMAVDVYAPYFSFQKHMYDTLMAIGKGKPVGISENGLMPDVPKLFSEGQNYVFWVTWWGFETAADNGGLTGNADAMYTKNYGSPYTITEDEIKLDIVSDGKFTVGASATVGGSVVVSPTGRVPSGTSVSITATPEKGFTFAGWVGDTTVSSSVNPLTVKVTKDRTIQAKFTPDPSTNLIKNGDFSGGAANWGSLNIADGSGAAGTVSFASGKAVVSITGAGTLGWHLQLSQSGIEFEKGVTYLLSFSASATATRTLGVDFSYGPSEDSTLKWKWLGGGTVDLTTEPQTLSVEVTPTVSAPAGVLQFGLGGSTAGVTIDNVTLVRKGGGTSLRPRSASAAALTLRAVANGFEWVRSAPLTSAATVRVVDLQGAELFRTVAKAGSTTGFVPAVGNGLRFVVLETAQARDIRTLTSAR